MFIDRRYFRYFDIVSFILTIAISCIGLLFVYSATYRPFAPYSAFFHKQLIGMSSGLLVYFLFCTIDYRTLLRWGYFLYFGIIGLLAITIVKGTVGMGAMRWIDVGLFKFQPSELAKLFLPAFITYYFLTEKNTGHYTIKTFAPILGILAISFILILKQPDLGTALLIIFSGFTLLWLAGLQKKYFIIGFLIVCICAPLGWHILKPYQKQRILVFMGQGEMHKERYQIEQAKIAIGSGGITGKGFTQGTQNTLMFLPESRTDFIFAVVCEEWGFLGAITLFALYLILFIRLFTVILTMKDFYAQLLASGLVLHIAFSTIINIGMVLGLLPIVGIPLPFMSYGISHLWITFASLGWFNGIAIRRFYMG